MRDVVYKKIILICVALYCCSTSMIAQGSDTLHTGGCGTNTYSPWLHWFLDNRSQLTAGRDVDTTWLYVPMTMHIVGNNDGSGYYPENGAFRVICEMNAQFEQARIFFYLLKGEEFVYHNNSTWYDHNWEGGADMIQSTRIPGRINGYFVENPAGNCGYSWYDAVVIGRNCSGAGNSTWAHEVGHHLSLPHPFYGWEGQTWDYSEPAPSSWDGYEVEKVDRSNCENSGDRFCDTDADYLNYRWQCNGEGKSTVVQTDPNGVPFRSDASLIMGYSLDACAGRFSPDQIEAMRNNLYFEHSDYLQETQKGPQLLNDGFVQLTEPIDSAIVQYDDAILHWNPVPGAIYYSVEIGLFSNFIPTIEIGTVTNATNYKIQKVLGKNRAYYWRVRAYSEWDLCAPAPITAGVFKTRDLSSTNNLSQVADINLSPNPLSVGRKLNLGIVNDESLDLVVEIHDLAGRICYEQFYRAYSGENQYELDTETLSAGMYFVTIKTNRGVLVKHLVVAE